MIHKIHQLRAFLREQRVEDRQRRKALKVREQRVNEGGAPILQVEVGGLAPRDALVRFGRGFGMNGLWN